MDFDSSVLQVPVEDIIPNRFQPRLNFDDSSLTDLAASIKEHGIIQPLVLRRTGDKYEIVAGERRYRASIIAGLSAVPAVITKIDDKKSAEIAVVENVQRQSLSAIEEARSFKSLLDKGEMTQTELAQKMGLSQSAVANKLRLLTLSNEVQAAVMDNQISERHARSLLAIKDHDTQLEWLDRIINERLTVRQLDEEIKKEFGVDVNASKINVDEIKKNSIDITPIPTEQKPSNNIFIGDAISLGEDKEPKFFNTLEDEAVNMGITERVNPFADFNNGYTLEKKEPVEEIETLDILPTDGIEEIDDLNS